MNSFDELVQSRRKWIDDVLIPWCRAASRHDLLLAETEWTDLAGRPAPEMTLWNWAWSRFPELCRDQDGGIDETSRVRVKCRDGRTAAGYPDARKSQFGFLFLVNDQGETQGPITIDDVESVEITG